MNSGAWYGQKERAIRPAPFAFGELGGHIVPLMSGEEQVGRVVVQISVENALAKVNGFRFCDAAFKGEHRMVGSEHDLVLAAGVHKVDEFSGRISVSTLKSACIGWDTSASDVSQQPTTGRRRAPSRA